MNDDDRIDPSRNGHAVSDACAAYRNRVSALHDGEVAEGDASGASGTSGGSAASDPWRRHALLCESCADFERRLPDVRADFAALRGTPVRDLWPALRDATSPAIGSARTPSSVGLGFAVAAAGALATWGLLSWLAAEGARDRGATAGLERALATISSESSGRVELARLLETPELRLLSALGAAKEDVR